MKPVLKYYRELNRRESEKKRRYISLEAISVKLYNHKQYIMTGSCLHIRLSYCIASVMIEGI